MDIYKVFLLSSILTFSSGFLSNGYSTTVPGTNVDRSQVSAGNISQSLSELDRLPTALSTEKHIILPSLTHEIDLGEAKKYKLRLKKVNIFGNTAISSNVLEKVFLPFYGKNITLAKLLGLIEDVTKIYHEQDYVLSQAYLPAQSIDKATGEINVGIVEGYVHEVDVISNSLPYSTKILVRQYGERMMSERPITKSTIERYALLANDLPGGNIKVVFAPAPDHPGAATVEFIAEDNKSFGFDLFTNNRGTRLLGPEEYSAVLYQFNGLYGNKTTLNGVRSDGKKMRYFMLNHRQPLNSDGLTLILNVNRTRTEPDFLALPAINRTAIETPGESDGAAVQLEYPFIRSRSKNLVASAKLTGSDNFTRFPQTNTILFKEKLRMFRVGANFDWLDSTFFGILSTTLIGFEYTQGIDGLDANLPPRQTTRPNVNKDFKKINGIVSRTQPLLPGLSLNLIGIGQHAFDELVSSEEFGYGGRVIGLGYDGFQISGDHGISGKAELAYSLPLAGIINLLNESLDVGHGSWLGVLTNFSINAFGFYDGGRVWNKDYRTSGQKEHDSAVSRGAGIRGHVFKHISYEGYVAKPMTRIAQNENDRKPRYFFSVGINYS